VLLLFRNFLVSCCRPCGSLNHTWNPLGKLFKETELLVTAGSVSVTRKRLPCGTRMSCRNSSCVKTFLLLICFVESFRSSARTIGRGGASIHDFTLLSAASRPGFCLCNTRQCIEKHHNCLTSRCNSCLVGPPLPACAISRYFTDIDRSRYRGILRRPDQIHSSSSIASSSI
jgi:hypothetical protein